MTSDMRFLTNHALALLCIAEDADARIRDIAERLDITERAAQRIVGELVEARFLRRARIGRRNRYEMGEHLPLSRPIRRVLTLGTLLEHHVARASDSESSSVAPAGDAA